LVLPQQAAASAPKQANGVKSAVMPHFPGDIVINLPDPQKSARKSKEKPAAKGKASAKEAKKPQSGSLFNKKKPTPAAMVVDAAVAPWPEHENNKSAPPEYAPPANLNEMTQLIGDIKSSGAKLRLIGDSALAPQINVLIEPGQAFTIGRFDVSIGRPQSSFEFEKNTKAVSRRHAAIERAVDGYRIIDLSSSAGTFVDGRKLPPNAPYQLKHGARVSFGNAATDYIWED
jgi:hypothetical protein